MSRLSLKSPLMCRNVTQVFLLKSTDKYFIVGNWFDVYILIRT